MASVFRKRDRRTGKKLPAWRFKFKGADGRWHYGVGWPDKQKTVNHAADVEADARAIRTGEKDAPKSTAAKRNTPIGTVTGEDSASLFFDMMPLSTHLAGSCHSHPNGVLLPSDADVHFFPRAGRFHFIIGYPYTQLDWRCYFSDGQCCRMEVIG